MFEEFLHTQTIHKGNQTAKYSRVAFVKQFGPRISLSLTLLILLRLYLRLHECTQTCIRLFPLILRNDIAPIALIRTF